MSYVCVCSLCIRKYYAIHNLRASDAKNTKLLPLARQNIHETHTHTHSITLYLGWVIPKLKQNIKYSENWSVRAMTVVRQKAMWQNVRISVNYSLLKLKLICVHWSVHTLDNLVGSVSYSNCRRSHQPTGQPPLSALSISSVRGWKYAYHNEVFSEIVWKNAKCPWMHNITFFQHICSRFWHGNNLKWENEHWIRVSIRKRKLKWSLS